MKVVHLNTWDISGGAARSAYRLHQGLRTIGIDSEMLVRFKSSKDGTVYSTQGGDNQSNKKVTIHDIIQSRLITSHITSAANTIFSIPSIGFEVTNANIVASADIINLHWIVNFLSPVSIRKIGALGKPLVWTLHDQWPFTGGCHYSNGCIRYETNCTECPQLDLNLELAATVLDEKDASYQSIPITVVTPSEWMHDVARKSRLFKSKRIECIPYSLETTKYTNIPKCDAKERLGIDPQVVTILFAAHSLHERRKGYKEFLEVLKFCENDYEFTRLITQNKIKLIIFGEAETELLNIGIPIQSLGFIDSDEEICTAYSAADLYIMTSLEDNLPNTILESMSCGTSVLAFDIGGIPDMVKEGVTGRLISPFDTRSMSTSLLYLLSHRDLLEQMSKNCRQFAETNYAFAIQAYKYKQLYDDILSVTPQYYNSEHAQRLTTVESLGTVYNLTADNEFCEHLSKIYPRLLEELVLEMTSVSSCERSLLDSKIHLLSAELESIKQSRSWKATAWLRNLIDALRLIQHR